METHWVWASGGLCAGCVLGLYVSKLTGLVGFSTLQNKNGRVKKNSIDMMKYIGQFNETVTTFSDITVLLGSPTSSALLDTHQQQEYNMYPAEKAYPVLDGNRYVPHRHYYTNIFVCYKSP